MSLKEALGPDYLRWIPGFRSLRRIPTGTDDFVPTEVKRPVMPRVRRALDGEEHRIAVGSAETSPESTAARLSDSMENTNVAFLVSEVVRSLAFFSREYPEASRQQGLVVLGADCVAERVSAFLQDAISDADYYARSGSGVAYRLPGTDVAAMATSYCKLVAIGAALGGDSAAVPALNLAQQGAAALIRRRLLWFCLQEWEARPSGWLLPSLQPESLCS